MSKPDDVTKGFITFATPAHAEIVIPNEDLIAAASVISQAQERERAECLKIIENTAQGSLQANLALSLAYETIKKRGEVK